MDERDNKAINELKMSKTEETNKLSTEDCLNKYLAEFDTVKYGLLHFSEFFASMRVEQAKEEWANEIKELKQEIYFLNNSSNFQ